MSRGRVGVFFLEPVTDSVPALVGLVETIAEAGWGVELFTVGNGESPPPRFESPAVTVHLLSGDSALLTLRGGGAAGGRSATGDGAVATLRAEIVALVKWGFDLLTGRSIDRLHAARPFDWFIGVEPAGLARAARHADRVGARLGYLSLELLLTAELRTATERRLKQVEVQASRQAEWIVVQDEERARLLAADNGLAPSRLLTVPNAPHGPVDRARGRVWHDRFGLSDRTKVLLYAGGLWPGTGVPELVSAAAALPEGWVLVVHTRTESASNVVIEECRRRAAPGKVFFSTTPTDRRTYQGLLRSADAGVALYTPVPDHALLGTNLSAIGLSSGKLASYLRAGLPVIVNDATSVGEFVREAGCGVVVTGADGIADAIRALDASTEAFRARAFETFERRLDPRGALDRVVAAMATPYPDRGRQK